MITSAALIMVCVFVGFVFSPDPVLKMIGVGLAVAVAIDATIVRVVLVPALMSLLGDRAWWLPRWLDRTLPSVNLQATTPARRPYPPRTRRQQPDRSQNLCPCPNTGAPPASTVRGGPPDHPSRSRHHPRQSKPCPSGVTRQPGGHGGRQTAGQRRQSLHLPAGWLAAWCHRAP